MSLPESVGQDRRVALQEARIEKRIRRMPKRIICNVGGFRPPQPNPKAPASLAPGAFSSARPAPPPRRPMEAARAPPPAQPRRQIADHRTAAPRQPAAGACACRDAKPRRRRLARIGGHALRKSGVHDSSFRRPGQDARDCGAYRMRLHGDLFSGPGKFSLINNSVFAHRKAVSCARDRASASVGGNARGSHYRGGS